MKVQELIDKVNSSIDCYSLYEAEEFIEGHIKCVAGNLDIEDHRWYTIATNVYKLEDGYVGITGPIILKHGNMKWSDCDYLCIAEEYEEFTTISYRRKK